MRIGSLIAALAVLVFAGCSSKPSVTENQCRAGDWQTIGYRDGAVGNQSTRLLAHQEACGNFSIVPERSRYLTGYREGLLTYCTAENGFDLGQRGVSLNPACNGDLMQPFATAHADGWQLYQARRAVNSLHQQLVRLDKRLDQIDRELVGVTTAQLQPDLTVEERVQLLASLESLADEKGALKARRPTLELDLAQAEADLESVSRDLSLASY